MHRLLITCVSASLALASLPASSQSVAVPARRSPNTYSRLWNNSPFTIKPETSQIREVAINPLSDWTLSGVIRLPNRTIIILQNTKNTSERIIVDSAAINANNIRILEIKTGQSFLDTRARVSINGSEGWITYDKKYLRLTNAAPNNSPQAFPPKSLPTPEDQPGSGKSPRNNRR